jgi:hypothetical protein
MILLALASLLLFFVIHFTGVIAIYFLNRFFAIRLAVDFFEIFLFGLTACFIYFNLLSFFTAVNYSTLLPLLPVSIAGFVLYSRKNNFFRQVIATGRLLFSGTLALFTIPVFALLFIYWIIPPFNIDSGDYHYISIRWYEQYKVVPGLANVHGRLAFNPASFIISAPFSFTDWTGQSLYPLNGVLVLLFYTWMLKKILTYPYGIAFNFILLICTILLFRTALANTSSPSSDLLSGLLLFYCGFRTYELIKEQKNKFSDYFPVLLFTCFAVTAKLTALPLLLLLPFIFLGLIEKKKVAVYFIKSSLLIALLILPWLARNMIMSGYLLYPVPGTNIIHADWMVPPDVVKLDYIYSKYGPRAKNPDFFALQKMNLYELTAVWLKNMYTRMRFSLAIASVSFLSLFTWLLFLIRKKKILPPVFLLWCIYYTCLLIWVCNSPTVRFGLSYIIVCTAIPFLEFTRSTTTVKSKIFMPAISILMFLCLAYYFNSAVQKGCFDHYPIAASWLKPARDKRYAKNNDIQTFPSVNLGNDVTLYYPDSTHECLNATGPCMNWRYGEIEMRGTKIEDGFRNTKDEVKKYYPFTEVK